MLDQPEPRPPAVPSGDPSAVVGPARLWRAWWVRQAACAGADPAVRLAIRQGFVISRRQWVELGRTPNDFRRELRRGTWSQPIRGTASPIVVAGDEADYLAERKLHALRSAAAALLRPEHAISGRSAAIVTGLPTFAVPHLAILTATDLETLGRRSSAHVRGATLHLMSTTHWFGSLITTCPRTIVDLARLDRRDGVMAADAALREGLTTRFAIQAAIDVAAGWPGVRQAREVLALADPRAESPLESITRLALYDDDFPPPEPQFWIGGDRVDFYWPRYRLVLEADGRAKYSDDALWEEKKREQRLRAHRDQVEFVERVVWSDITRTWSATRARLRPYFRPR